VHPVSVPIEFLAPGLVFAAGGFYFVVRQALQSLAAEHAELKRRATADHYRFAVILLSTCQNEKREQIASWLLQSIMGD
jgi:hypothetical protein